VKRYRVWCRVSGGVTGTRESHVKANGVVMEFETYEEAARLAAQYMEAANGRWATANFEYRPVEVAP